MKITYWSDYACPYCYIGETRLRKALEELGLSREIPLEMKAFQLDPDAPLQSERDVAERIARKYGMTLEQAKEQVAQISETGRQDGLAFHYEGTLSTNTLDAHRLTKYAASLGDDAMTQRLIDRLFHANFADNQALADHAVLLQAAEDAGLNRQKAEELLHSDEFRREVLSDQLEAEQYGVRAVPFFTVGRYCIPGAVPIHDFKEVIRQVLTEESAPVCEGGYQCGPSGCHLA